MKVRDSALKAALYPNADRKNFVVSRNKVTEEIRKVKAKYFIDVISEAKGNTVTIWK